MVVCRKLHGGSWGLDDGVSGEVDGVMVAEEWWMVV